MSTSIEAIPAYGREYTKQKQISTDWEDGKDFMIIEGWRYGAYVNKEDAERYDLKVVIRYANKLKVFAVN